MRRHRVPHALLLCATAWACRDLVVRGDEQMSGTHRGRDVTVRGGAHLTAIGDLELVAENDLVVDGTISASADASIVLTSLDGSVRISGVVQSGDGANAAAIDAGFPRDAGPDGGADGGATMTDAGPSVIGAAGQPAGSISISAANGSVIIDGEVLGGRGGNGSNVSIMADAQVVTAISGPGGAGGDIRITAAREVTGAGGVAAGNGGHGGDASAFGTQHAVARSRSGGHGGNVFVQLGTTGTWAGLQQGFHGGTGGDVYDALAHAEVTAQSTADTGGPGGNCIVDGPPAMSVSRPEPGRGGGALGDHRASSRVGAPSGADALVKGGGPGGSGNVRGATVLTGDGGDGAGARAESASGIDVEKGRAHAGSAPGGASHAYK